MSKKESSVLNWYWWNLAKLSEERGHQVSAGELARYMGVARNTARKWCEKLVKHGASRKISFKHVTGVRASLYFASTLPEEKE